MALYENEHENSYMYSDWNDQILAKNEKDSAVSDGESPTNRLVNGDRSETMTSAPSDRDGETAVAPSVEVKKKKLTFTWRQKLIFIGVAMVIFTLWMSLSIMSPFFPVVAEQKGVSPVEVGFVFGISSVSNFVGNIFFGKYLPVFGVKLCCLGGCIVAATCDIVFGVLNKIQQKEPFLASFLVLRVVEALGMAASETASTTIVANTFPDNLGQMSGLLEIFVGLGVTVGPLVGSFLYQLGGFGLPFYVLGGFAVLVSVVNIFIIPTIAPSEESHAPGSILRVARIPAIQVVCFTAAVSIFSFGFNDPTLSVHVTAPPLSVSPSFVGILFLANGGCYALTGVLFGYIGDKKDSCRILMVLGCYFTGISFMLMGPSPLFNLSSKTWIAAVAQATMGVATAAVLIPVFIDPFTTVRWYGLPDDIATQAVVSGLIHGAFSIGNFIGPIASGFMMESPGYEWSTTIVAGCNFIMMGVLSVFTAWEFRWGKGRRKPPPPCIQGDSTTNLAEDENPLIQEED